MKLKIKWASAIAIASAVFAYHVTAINAVMVVPIFAPIINGAACFNEANFFATMGTTTEVVIVLERMAAVVSMPHPNDFHCPLKKKRLNASGLFARSRFETIFRKITIDTNNKARATNANNQGGMVEARNPMIVWKPRLKLSVT